jgi:glycosyltransferase involved in cell wall biosynthesis
VTGVTYIISDINKALAFEWVAESINRQKVSLSFILLNSGDSILEKYLIEHKFPVKRIGCRGKKDWMTAIAATYRQLKKWKPDVVHCHLLQANIIGLVAARMAGIHKRIYTRHHSSLHHVYFKKGIWWDKLANRLATHIIAISGVVREILAEWEKVPASKIYLIPHGFKLESFTSADPSKVDLFKQRHGIKEKNIVVGVVSRFTEWKGIQYIIPAFVQLLNHNPDAVLLLLNAQGDYEKEIHKLLTVLPEHAYRVIKFEADMPAAYKSMHVFVHTPIDGHCEAFGQTYVEALAAGVPGVFTLSGIASDFIENGKNAWVVPFKDSVTIYQKIQQILSDPDGSMSLVRQGKKDVQQRFTLDKMINSLEHLYVIN